MPKPEVETRKETIMQHVHRHGILGPKGLLTPGSVLSAILIGGIVVLLAGQSAYTQVDQEANKVLVGATAFGDWHNDAPESGGESLRRIYRRSAKKSRASPR
jgi:hypothetical protein